MQIRRGEINLVVGEGDIIPAKETRKKERWRERGEERETDLAMKEAKGIYMVYIWWEEIFITSS